MRWFSSARAFMWGIFSWGWMPSQSPPRLPCQESSMLMYVQPWLMRPVSTIALAEARTFSASTSLAQQFQLFQPIGGGGAPRSPVANFNFFVAGTLLFGGFCGSFGLPLLSILP